MKTIDIIMPTLNRDIIIEHSIKSILSQTNSNWRLVIFDNGSTDKTKILCEKYTYDNRIKYVRSEKTLDVHNSWEKSISYVKSDYFVVFSDDDIMKKNFIAEVSKYSEKKKYDLIVTNRGTNAPLNTNAIVRNKVIVSKGMLNKAYEINPKEILISYGSGQALNGLNNLQLHPTMLIISKNIKEKIQNLYGRFYMPVAHDYFNGVMLGLYSEIVLFIDKPLVIIGGYQKMPYCFFSNKFDYFGMDFSKSKQLLDKYSSILPHFITKLETYWDLPYFSSNILKQTLITLDSLKRKDEEKYQTFVTIISKQQEKLICFLERSVADNYVMCRDLGDPVDEKLEKLQVAQNNWLKKVSTNVTIAIRKVLITLNKNQNSRMSRILCLLNNRLNKNTSWYYYTQIEEIHKMSLK